MLSEQLRLDFENVTELETIAAPRVDFCPVSRPEAADSCQLRRISPRPVISREIGCRERAPCANRVGRESLGH